MGKQEAISRQQFDDLKDLIQEEALITRRTIVKTSQLIKMNLKTIRKKLLKHLEITIFLSLIFRPL